MLDRLGFTNPSFLAFDPGTAATETHRVSGGLVERQQAVGARLNPLRQQALEAVFGFLLPADVLDVSEDSWCGSACKRTKGFRHLG